MEINDWIGTVGVSMILLAFILNLLKILMIKDFTYILLNFLGASLAGVASLLIAYIPFVILEGVWTCASFVALISYLRNKFFLRIS